MASERLASAGLEFRTAKGLGQRMDFHDPVAAGLHLGFAVWCLFAGGLLLKLTQHHPRGHRISVAVYAFSAVLLYTCSGLFHSLSYESEADPKFEFFRRLDLSAIFGLIAGSCVPICLYTFRGFGRWVCLTLEVGAAIVGISLVWAMDEVVTQTLIFVYIGMGMVAIIPIPVYYRQWGTSGIALMFAFAGFYVAGAVFQAVKWPGYYHVLLHLCDMIATLLHVVLLWKFVFNKPTERLALESRATRARRPAPILQVLPRSPSK